MQASSRVELLKRNFAAFEIVVALANMNCSRASKRRSCWFRSWPRGRNDRESGTNIFAKLFGKAREKLAEDHTQKVVCIASTQMEKMRRRRAHDK